MLASTAFGELDFPTTLATKQRDAVLRALSWCDELADTSDVWSRHVHDLSDHGTSLNREINGKTLSIYPLAAARLDAGLHVRQVNVNHLPVWVDGHKICVVGKRGRGHDLHTDLVASLILLFCQEEPVYQALPRTLVRAIYPQFGSGHEGRYRLNVRPAEQEAVFEPFREHLAEGEWEPLAYLMDLTDRDWTVLRDRFPWGNEPEAALNIAYWVMEEHERPANDHLWVINIVRQHAPEDLEEVLRSYLYAPQDEVRRQALMEYHPQEAEAAWRWLEPCFELEAEERHRMLVHETLQEYPELEERLIQRSLQLVEDAEAGVFQRLVVAWLSHHVDMDEWLFDLLPSLEPYELGGYLHEIQTYGDWFEDFATECLAMPFEGVHLGVVACSATNLSFNPFPLWLPLMQNGSGTMKLNIMKHLHRLPLEEAYLLLELGWKSQWRFVITATHRTVAKAFPDYPLRAEMEAHGYTSVQHWKR